MVKFEFGFLVCAAAFAAFVAWKAARNEAAAMAAFPPDGQLVDVGDTTVHAVVMGDGPDVVLIHGASGNTRDMTFSLAGRLAETYRVIVFDRPGLGYTPAINPRGDSIADQARVLQLASAELGAEQPIVVGQSYGGAVALAWATEYPQNASALVLLAAASQRWEGGLSNFYKITSSRLGQIFIVPLLTAFVPESYVTNTINSIFEPQQAPDGYGAYVGAPLTLKRSALRHNANQRASLKDEITDMMPRYPQIRQPVEILHGDADTIVPLKIHSAKLVEQIPRANLTVLLGVGHMPQHVAEDDVVAAIGRAAERAGLRN